MSVGGSRTIFRNQKGDKLCGMFIDCNSRDVVILCHGYASCKDSQLIGAMAAALQKQRISSLRFDFAGNGEAMRVGEWSCCPLNVLTLRYAQAKVTASSKSATTWGRCRSVGTC